MFFDQYLFYFLLLGLAIGTGLAIWAAFKSLKAKKKEQVAHLEPTELTESSEAPQIMYVRPLFGQPGKIASVSTEPSTSMTAQSALFATLSAVLLSLFWQLPTLTLSDVIPEVFTYANQIVIMMKPIIGVGAGIGFGFSLVAYIIRIFRQAL